MNIYLAQALIFLLVNFSYLLSRSVLWDGKLWYQLMHNHDFSGLFWMTHQNKLPLVFHLYAYLADTFNPVFIAKLISFVSLLFAGLIFRWFIEKAELGSPRARFLAGTWYCFMPCYLVGIEFCHVSYNLAILVFFLGAFIHSSTMADHKNGAKFTVIHLIVFSCFYVSFTANKAFLFLYPLFIVQSIFQYCQYKLSKKSLFLWLKNYWFLLLFPFVYWSLKDQPTGIYNGYNAINLKEFGKFFEAFKIGLKAGNAQTLTKILTWTFTDYILMALSLLWFAILFLISKKIPSKRTSMTNKPLTIGLVSAILLMLMIIFPYAAVGKHAQFIDFESRHALLFVFPQALIILFSFTLIENRSKYSTPLFLAVLLFYSCVAAAVFENHRRNDVDWYKRQAMVENFKVFKPIQEASIIGIEDHLLEWNHLNRGVEFYELSAFSEDAFGDQKRLIYDSRFPVDNVLLNTPGVPERYNFKEYNPNGKHIKVLLTKGTLNLLDWKNYIYLKWLENMNYLKFKQEIKNAIEFRIAKDS